MWFCCSGLALAAGVDVYKFLRAPDQTEGDGFGSALAPAGDVFGDGFGSVLAADALTAPTGHTYLFRGGYLDSVAGPDVLVPVGAGVLAHGTGDLNDDGYSDIVVSAPLEDVLAGSARVGAGAFYVFLGGPDEIGEAMRFENPAPVLDGSDEFGAAIEFAGDMDGDGFDDLLVSAPGASVGGELDAGTVWLYRGGPDGLDASPPTALYGLGLTGERFGALLAGGMDLDGDRVDDFAVFAAGTEVVYVLGLTARTEVGFGIAATSLAIANVGRGGWPDLMIHDGDLLTVVSDFHLGVLVETESVVHAALLVPAGDMDGDGYLDLLISDPAAAPIGTAALIYGGGAVEELAFDETFRNELAPFGDVTEYGVSLAAPGPLGISIEGPNTLVVGAPATPGYTGKVFIAKGVCEDDDDDGVCGRDCDDEDGASYPGAAAEESELLCMRDADGDGWGDASATGAVVPGSDCDDTRAEAHPGAPEVPGNGQDEDCDGREMCFIDADGDGYGGSAVTPSDDLTCAEPPLVDAGPLDCDDGDPERHEGAEEGIGDEVDQDCDGGELCLVDADGDGVVSARGGVVVSEDEDCADAGEAPLGAPEGDCNDFVVGAEDCKIGCQCAATGGWRGSLWGLAAAALTARRRRVRLPALGVRGAA